MHAGATSTFLVLSHAETEIGTPWAEAGGTL